jgi:hypothetical protein
MATFQAPTPPQLVAEGPGRGERIAAAATENALSGVGNQQTPVAPIVISPTTSVQSNQTSMMLPVNVNNGEDTHQWATRENYKPV